MFFVSIPLCLYISTNPWLLLLKVLSLIEVYVNASSSLSKCWYKILGCANAWAILPIGLLPGLNVQIFQLEPAPAIKPLCKDGIKPDFTKEDLPLPDEPITAKNFTILSFFINSSTCFSLPKNSTSSSSSKERSPGKGLNMLVSVSMVDV